MKILEIYAGAVSIQSREYGTRGYLNSVNGRADLIQQCPREIVDEVMAVWGDTPTETDL